MHSTRLRSGFALVPMLVLALTGCVSMKSLEGSPSDIALAEENYQLKNDQEKLRQQLADAKAAQQQVATANAATTASSNDLKQQLDVAEEKLEQALRSYTQSQKENARLQAELDKADAQNAILGSQIADLKAKLEAASRAASAAAAAPAPVAAAPAATIAAAAPATNPDTEANLATALHSYALLREESDQIKSDRDKLAAEKVALESQISALKGAVPLASQAEGLREQLRQTQAQSAAFAEENARLKTQLSFNGGGTGMPSSRSNVITPVAVTTVPDAVPTPTPAPAKPEPRVHTIAGGDTLSKIALKYYGSASRWPEILEANRDTLKNENSLVAGKTIRIP